MASSDLSWTEAEATVNQIAEYQIYRATKVGSAEIGDFVLIGTNVVTRDDFGEITNPVTSLEFSDGSVDFGTETYQYRVDAISVFVGEAPSPQSPPGQSNIIALGTQPSAVVLTGMSVGDSQVDLSWTASTPALNPVTSYEVQRSTDGGAFVVIGTTDGSTLTFSDTTVTLGSETYDYKVIAIDEIGIRSDDSNIVSFGLTNPIYVALADFGTAASVMTSPDLVTWTSRTTPAQRWEGIAFSDSLELFVAVGFGSVDNLMVSDDAGISDPWTVITGQLQTGTFSGVARSESLGLFAACIDSGSAGFKIATSSDGLVWTYRATPASADTAAWADIIWVEAESLFYCCASSDSGGTGLIMTSPDGITWTHESTSTALGLQCDRIAYVSSERGLFASNRSDLSHLYSLDGGATWLFNNNPNGTNAGQGGAASDGTTAALCAPAGGLFFNASTAAGDFAVSTGSPPTAQWEGIGHFSKLGLWAAVAQDNHPNQVVTTPDITSGPWTLRTTPSDQDWKRIIEGGTPF